MIQRDTPKRVTLSNGRTFVTRYQRLTRSLLPVNILLNHSYKQRAPPKSKQRRRQVAQHQGCGICSFSSKLCKLAKKVAKGTNYTRSWQNGVE